MKEPYVKACLNSLNRFMSVIFFFEIVVKVIARGFCANKWAYMRDSFNVFDFFIVLMVTVTLVPEYLYETDPDGY